MSFGETKDLSELKLTIQQSLDVIEKKVKAMGTN